MKDPKDPDPKTFDKAMHNLSDATRPDVAARATETLAEVGPEDEVRSDPEAPEDVDIPRPHPPGPARPD